MELMRYFLLNEQDLSPSVVRTALVKVKQQTSADPPRLTTVDVDGNYFATTTSMGQLTLLEGYLRRENIPFKLLTERPRLKAAAPTSTDKVAPQPHGAREVDEIFEMVDQAFDRFDKFLQGLSKPT